MTLEERRDILFAAQHDLEGEEMVDGKLVRFRYRERFNRACAADPVFFINTCCWIFDPEAREESRTEIPFLLRPLQEDYIRELRVAIDSGYDLLTEKSRSMGATWCVLAMFFWYWMFERNATFLIGSLNRDKTDRVGDKSTLFAKLDFLADALKVDVPWLIPEGYDGDKPNRTYLKMLNPANGAAITGEAPGTEFGRSGRYKAIFLDEFAKWPFGHASWTACSLTARCHLPVSTPAGMGNMFGKLANPKKGTKHPIKKARLYWADDPSKNYWEESPKGSGNLIQPWLEYWKAHFDYDPTMLAQEVEIDYNRSVSGLIYPQIERARLGIFEYDRNLPLFTTWDFGVRDYCAIIWIQYDEETGRHRVIDSLQANGKPIAWYIPFITGRNLGLGENHGGYKPEHLEIINRHAGYEYDDHFGDPSGKNRNTVTATSVINKLAEHGIYIRTNDKMRTHEQRIDRTRMLTPLLDIDERYNDDFLEAMRNYRWPEEKEGSEATSLVNKPVHDVYSHFATSLEFYAVNQKLEHMAVRRAFAIATVAETMDGPRVVGSYQRYVREKEAAVVSGKTKQRIREYAGSAGY